VAAEELTVRGLTGVDMTLRVAGPGTRSYAFVIDWHIRLLAALAWVALGALFAPKLPTGRDFSSAFFVGLFAIPALAIYFLYHPVLELAMRGRTPGKRMAGARIVTREGATPSSGALLLRNVFRLIDSLPTLYLVGLVCCLVTAQRVRIGDLAAGTVLILDDAPSAKSLGRLGTLLQHTGLDPNALQLVQDLLERWPMLQKERRTALARTLLARLEPALDPMRIDELDERALRSHLQSLLADKR
jgi:uncharacterized RDD family membrane protein YckC